MFFYLLLNLVYKFDFRKHPTIAIDLKSYNQLRFRMDLHFLDIKLTESLSFSVVEHSLPIPNAFLDLNESALNLIDSFLMIKEQLNDYYSSLDTIDTLCYVLDPPKILPQTNWRLIKFNDDLILKIVVNPLNCAVSCSFFGKDSEVERLMEQYNQRIHKWDLELDIHKNLLRFFK